MSNALKGEVTIDLGDENYTLVYSVNAIIALEEKTGLPITRIGDLLGADTFSFANARTFFWAGLVEHQPDISEADAGAIMSELGIEEALKLATESLNASMPSGGGKSSARPRRAPGGIGKGS